MFRRPQAVGIGLLFLLTAGPIRAENEYWVAVGSYQKLTNAEQAVRDASLQLAASFTMRQVDTASGTYFRVLSGPFLSFGIANSILTQAQYMGFESPWIIARENDGSGTLLTGKFGEPVLNSTPLEPVELYGSEDTPGRTERQSEHRLVDEAPDDYHLHRLNRDQK